MLENNRFFVLENNRFSVLENSRFSVLENNRCPWYFGIFGPGQDLFGGAEQNFSRRAFFDVHSEHPFMDLIEESSLADGNGSNGHRMSQALALHGNMFIPSFKPTKSYGKCP